MSTNEPNLESKFFENLKENYIQRIRESDNFCKRFTNACLDVNTELLYGSLNTVQHFIDFQKKTQGQYATWYDNDYMINQSRLITEAWLQAVQGMDSFYIEFFNFAKNNLKVLNKNFVNAIRDFEKFYDVFSEMPEQTLKPDLESQTKPIIAKKQIN